MDSPHQMTICIWCGMQTDDPEDEAPFLFLAMRDGTFTSTHGGGSTKRLT